MAASVFRYAGRLGPVASLSNPRSLAIAAGVAVGIGTAALLRLPPIWAAMVAAGLGTGVLSLTARDFRIFWLGVFALVLPLEIKKMLVDSSPMVSFVLEYGIPVGEMPAPVLYLSDMPFALLMGHWIVRLMLLKEPLYFPKSNKFALALLCWSALTMVNAAHLPSAVFDLLRMLKFYLLYLYLANNLPDRRSVKVLVSCLLVGVVLQGALCLTQYATQDIGARISNLISRSDSSSDVVSNKIKPLFNVAEEGSQLKRAGGTVGPVNAEAQYFEFLVPIAMLLTVAVTSRQGSLLWPMALVSGVLGLALTFSRGGAIGLLAGAAVAIFAARRRNLITRRRINLIVALTVFVGLLASPFVFRYLTTRPEATQARLHLARVGLEMVKAHPLMGVGINNHLIRKVDFDPKHYAFQLPTHNHYLIVASELGITGLILFVGFFVVTFRQALAAGRGTDPYLATVAVGGVGALTAIALHLSIDYLGTHANFTLLWLHAGLAAALFRLNPPAKG